MNMYVPILYSVLLEKNILSLKIKDRSQKKLLEERIVVKQEPLNLVKKQEQNLVQEMSLKKLLNREHHKVFLQRLILVIQS